MQELFILVEMQSPPQEEGWGLRSRAVTPDPKRQTVKWHERLVMALHKGALQGDAPSHKSIC